MANKENPKKKTKDGVPPQVAEMINAYRAEADALGSYTGNTEDMPCMPRKVADGKIYLRIEGPPVQDADDL